MIGTNHIATNIVTKGLIYSFPLTEGILTNLQYEIITVTGRKHGGISWVDLQRDIHKYDDITAIKVYIDWFRKTDREKYVSVQLLQKKIYAELLQSNNNSINIQVEIL